MTDLQLAIGFHLNCIGVHLNSSELHLNKSATQGDQLSTLMSLLPPCIPKSACFQDLAIASKMILFLPFSLLSLIQNHYVVLNIDLCDTLNGFIIWFQSYNNVGQRGEFSFSEWNIYKTSTRYNILCYSSRIYYYTKKKKDLLKLE